MLQSFSSKLSVSVASLSLLVSSAGWSVDPPIPTAAKSSRAGGQSALGAVRGAPSVSCDLTKIVAPANTTILSVTKIDSPVPYCRVDGYYTTQNPGPNKVRFMLAAPQSWNGRFLFTVQGGAAGWVPDPSPEHLTEGYAIAATDKGVVTSGGLDFKFFGDPAMYEDYVHRGTHVASIATQALAKQIYGRPTFPRYIMGCSGGGMGTTMEAEKYPADYDAFVAGGIPASGVYSVTPIWAVIAYRMNKVPGSWISPDEYKRIYEALLAKYDPSDGALDGLIWDPRVIKLDASDRATLSFLSDAQFGTLKVITGGLGYSKGKRLSYGFLLGNPSAWPRFLTGTTPPPWPNLAALPAGFAVSESGAKGVRGPAFSYLTGPDPATPGYVFPAEAYNVLDSNRLTGLKRSGSKMIQWIGTAEEAIPPPAMIAYADEIKKKFGAVSDSFYRFYLIPGMHHCGRGENAPTDHVDKMLKAAQRWVEQGRAPTEIVVSNGPAKGFLPSQNAYPRGKDVGDRTYLLCPYPHRSVFKGGIKNPAKLEVRDAKNWKCV